ncbi:MAG: tetratricopeptide repeat protein [candidate division Zixibacteria bacterium]|nr:tetratricopeptide repeat protein [candidate division Zixibacteria bacterium]
MAKKKRALKANVNIENLAAMVERADKFFAKGEYKKTIKLCRDAIDRFGDSITRQPLAKIYFMWILAQMRLDDYKPIEELLDRAKSQIGSYLDITFMKVMAAYGNEEFEKAVKLVEVFNKEHSQTDPNVDRFLKQCYSSLDEVLWLGSEAAGKLVDIDKALDFMGRSLAAKPHHHRHRVEYVSLLAKQNKAEKAFEAIDEGINKYPDVIALMNAKGLVFSELERYEEAEQYFNRLLEQHPNNTDALNNLGVIYDNQGKYEQAKSQFRKALDIEPDNVTARDNLQHLNDSVDDKPQTISACMIVKDEEKFLPGCLESIKDLVDEIIIVDTGSTDRTMEIAREYGATIYEHPWQNDFSYHRNQSIDYGTKDWILIIDADEEFVQDDHETIKMAIRRKDIEAISFVVYNKIQLGRVGFLNSHRMFRNHKGYKYHGIVHNQLDISGKTLMTQLRVIHHGYGLSDEQMEKKGKRTEALLLQQLKENPDLIFPHFNLAQIYRGLSKPEKSLEHAKIVIDNISIDDLDHRHVLMMALDQMGCAYIGIENLEKAEEIFKKALDYKEDYLDPMFNLGFMYMRQKRYIEAEEIFLRYLKTRDEYAPHKEWMGLILNNLQSQFAVYYSLGFVHYLRNDVNMAFEFFQKSLAETDDFEYLHHLLARIYRDKGEFAKILEHCEKAIEYDHEDAEIRLFEGEAHLNLGNADLARKCFNRALEIEPGLEDAHIGLIGADSLDKDPASLLKSIDDFLLKSPSSPQMLASRGDVQFNLGNYGQAKESYQKTTAQYPNDYKVLNNLGNCFLKENNYASAETYYLMALSKNKDFLPGYRNLAVSLINQGKTADAAEYLEYYLHSNPADAEVHVTLGDIYYGNKEYSRALGHFEKYMMFYPGNMSALIRLSDCYFNMGHLKAASAGYKAVLAKEPDNQIADKRLGDLDNFLKETVAQ